MKALIAKYSEGQTLTADVPTIFGLWQFAAEHWQQARQQSAAAPAGQPLSVHSINVNKLSAADDETIRQLGASAVALTRAGASRLK